MCRFFFGLLFLFSLSYSNTIYDNSLDGKILHSASELSYPPFSIVTKDAKAGGFSVELLQKVVEAMGGKVDFYVDTWSQIKEDLKNRKIDVLPVVGRTPEREKDFDFTVPYLVIHGAVFIRSDDTLKSEKDLWDKDIIVMKGDNAEEYVTREGVGKNIIALDTYEEAFKELSAGKYDAIIVQQLVGYQLIKQLKIKNIKIAPFVLKGFRQDFSFAVAEGNKELLSLLNEGIAIIQANGTYEQLRLKWFSALIDDDKIDYKVLILFVILSGVFGFGLLIVNTWNRILTKKVKDKTSELEELNETLEERVEQALDSLKQKEELMIAQSRQAAMGEAISMIAHQWRQPLAVIGMGANNIILDMELGTLDDASLRENVDDILEYTQYLSQTIDDFRDFFLPSKDKDDARIEDIMDKAYRMMKISCENNNIALTISSDNKSVVSLYSRELLQVFINLLKNAKEAFSKNNTGEKKIEITISETKDFVITRICDNAGGIDETILNEIFNPYFSTKDEETGTGLGLYMSKTIIEKHLHGSIHVANKNGGACFEVRIPKNSSEVLA